nr:MAG TPA: hypothetical protein [Bacteriophage sp.]
MRMLIHSEIPSLHYPSGSLEYLRICVRDTKILVLEEELNAIELIVEITPTIRILVAQLTVVLLVFIVQIIHHLTLVHIDLSRKLTELVWRDLLIIRNGGTILLLAQKTGQQLCTLLENVKRNFCLRTVLTDIEKLLNTEEVSTLNDLLYLGDLTFLLILADLFCRLVCDVGYKVALNQLLYNVVY